MVKAPLKSCDGSGLRHYEVVSPTITDYHWGVLEPPEDYVCWGCYLAKNAKDAIRQSVAGDDFSPWVQEQRGDGSPPFKGLKASPAVCEHGVCWGCEGITRPKCEPEEEVEAWFEVSGNPELSW